MDKVTVIIPARNEPYLSKTVDDLFEKATSAIEVITILDGYWPVPQLPKHNNLIQLHFGKSKGMRDGINAAVEIASGKYLLKIDAHCMVGEGFDEALKSHCDSNWLTVPTRYTLDAENWKRLDKPAIEYLYLTFPFIKHDKFGFGMHGAKWAASMKKEDFWKMENDRKDVKIDDIMAFQGSCWFMHKQHFFNIGKLDSKLFYNIYQESQELCMKTWLSGGAVKRNKHTWYAHLHKTREHGQAQKYNMSKRLKIKSEEVSVDYWMNDRWPKATRKIKWFVEHFWPIPGWPEDWENKEKYGY